jgi:hypothetical protein
MEARTTLHRLLHLALIDMRVAAYEQRPQPIFYMADLMHTLPLQLERAAQGECTYEEVLSQLRQRAQDKGQAYEKWLESRLEDVHHWSRLS